MGSEAIEVRKQKKEQRERDVDYFNTKPLKGITLAFSIHIYIYIVYIYIYIYSIYIYIM